MISLLYSLVLAFVIGLVTITTADADTHINRRGSAKSMQLSAKKRMTVIVSSDSASLRMKADTNAKPALIVPWLTSLDIDPSRAMTSHSKWIPVLIEIPGELDRGPQQMWVETQDVVVGHDFKKVTSCWPVKRMEIEIGDSATSFTFAPDGSGTFSMAYDENHPREKTTGRLHVYIEKNILLLKNNDPRGARFPLLGIKIDENKIFAYGIPVQEIQLFDTNVVNRCNSIGIENK
jgi:hypothetical protein